MKPSRIMLMVALFILPLFIYGSVAIGADDQATDRAPGAESAVSGFEDFLTPGDILWNCDIEHFASDSDDQCLGVEFDGYYYYITGGGGTTHGDPNKVHLWRRVGGVCQYQCSVDQPTWSSWGWRDIVYDGTYLYSCEDIAGTKATPCTVMAWTADCDSVTLHPSHHIVLDLDNFPGLSLARALAYDPATGWFWTADFNSPIYAFDRAGTRMDSIGNTYAVYGMAWDDLSPNGPFLWVHTQSSVKIRQVDPNAAPGSEYTGVVYAGYDDGAGGEAGGLCLDRSGCGTLIGVSQSIPDMLYAMEFDTSVKFTHLDTTYVPWSKISKNTKNKPLLGFRIDCVEGTDYLESITIKSFIQKAFSIEKLKLWMETGGGKGLQTAWDTPIAEINIKALVDPSFDSNDTLKIAGLHRLLKAAPDSNLFYITIDAWYDTVNAAPTLYHEQCLEVVLETGRIVLNSGTTNPYMVYNRPYGGFGDDTTGFCPESPPAGGPDCRYRLCFDTIGPQFDLHFCIEENTCSTYAYYEIEPYVRVPMVDHEDSVRICATNWDSDIKGDITVFGRVHLLGDVSTLYMFGVPNVKLKCPDPDSNGCEGVCDTCYTTGFRIPNVNTSQFKGVDADTGHWYICAWAEDSAGNRDTICIGHDQLPLRIDTQDPIIDEITWEFVTDLDPVGKINLGDCIMIIAKGYSNAIEPLKECVQMRVDTSWMADHAHTYPAGEWAVMSDTLQENNRIFRRTFCLTNPLPIDSSGGCPVNFLVEAWDNACNSDTMTGQICADMDLDPPDVSVLYEWHTDYDTMWACMSLGDKVLIRAYVTDGDIASVTAMMDSAGIDELMRHALPLPNRGGGVYDTIWTITEPPIIFGKDRDNTQPPARDSLYDIWVTVCDDGGNCVSGTDTLNKTLDTRRPRPVGFACPDTIPCALHAMSKPGGIIELYWDQDCDEDDAYAFYIWALAPGASEYDSIGYTDVSEQTDPNFYFWHSEPLAEGYWQFKIKTEDNCSNVGDFSCVVGAYADATPPHVCIAVPDSGLTFGSWFPVKAVADSESHDVESASLWYRFRPDLNDPPLGEPGQWTQCLSDPYMYRYDDGIVFTDSVHCLEGVDYIGWVEMIVVACDEVGNCQDTTMAFDDACLVDDDVFRPGHFLFYWDTLAPGIQLVSVNGFPSPQSACGFDVQPGDTNWLVIDVPDAAIGELFEVEVRALCTSFECRIFHQDTCAMPLSIPFFVDGWPEGTQNLYINVKDYDNDMEADLQVEVCVPPTAPENCVYISWPHEWMRIPCTGTSGYNCVLITADIYDYAHCEGDTFTEARFEWSPTGSDPWYWIADEIGSGPWTTCWDNTGLVEDGDTVYLRVIAHDEFYMADTSYMVKVFVDCTPPAVKLRIEEVYYTCGNEIPKVSCYPLTLKAVLEDTLIDIDRIRFFFKRHSVPDIHEYWIPIDGWAEPAWSDNIWMYFWEDPCCDDKGNDCMEPGDYYDIRVAARDIAGHYMYDYDNDGFFDDSTFNQAVYDSAGFTVFVDNEAPQPAISRVADTDTLGNLQFEFVNPDDILGGSDKVYSKAFDSVTVEISVLPSEDTCEVMKVEYYGCNIYDTCVHLGTSFEPNHNHWPVTFEPVAQGLMPPQKIENSWWQGKLVAVLYDSLGNSKNTMVNWYILDVTPSQAIIVNPLNDSYVWGSVLIESRALNAYEIAKVCYEYRRADCPYDQDTCWHPVNGGYPNACAYHECGEDIYDERFPIVWNTLNTVPDGEYYLRAVATDCSNNEDDDPPTIMVTVANELPTAIVEDPRICERECPDDTVDILGYIAGTVTLYATASSTIPVDRVVFMNKDIFDFPGAPWDTIGIDYFPTGGKYSVQWNTNSLDDGRYHLKARVYNAAGRYGDSEPITISVDNSAPFSQIVSVMGEPVPPTSIDITKGDVIDIELWAMDSTSDEGWTRCYNSGLVGIEMCIEDCVGGTEYTKCFEVSPVYDGFHTVQWNTSGLEFDGCEGCYRFYVKAWDCLGNTGTSEKVTVNVYDITAPITTIGGFDGAYIYGYSSEKVSTLLFQYADSGSTDWIPIGWSSYIGALDCNGSYMYLYKTAWDPSILDDGIHQVRVISHDSCSNQDDSLAPVAFLTAYYGSITPYNPDYLGAISFLKNWCVGGMHGVVLQTVQSGAVTPMMLARYLNSSGAYSYECVHMQAHQQNSDEYAGSFYADDMRYGGSAEFFSSITLPTAEIEQYTGDEPAYVTYLRDGTFDVVKVKCDLGTHGMYQDGCVELTIPDGAISCSGPEAEYVWVSPTYMEWAPVTQPDILPIGDDNGYATYISFTECRYCCGFGSSYFGDDEAPKAGAGFSNDEGRCCFRDGKHAIIKMCYDSLVVVPEDQLAVAWWDCRAGTYKFDPIFYPATVEGFDTENHTVEFATTCLKGPFVVVQLLERECDGSIVVRAREQDIEPYCNGYTNDMPTFTALITDNVQGPSAIDQSSIKWWIDLFEPGELIKIYDGAESDVCDRWMKGFGCFEGTGYDAVAGIFRAGWHDPDYAGYDFNCDECTYYSSSTYYCRPMYPLDGGSHMAVVTAMNENIQTCTDTVHFTVDATEPRMWFADSAGAYVGENPHFCIYFTDAKAGVDKSSIWIDIYGDESSSPDPNNHQQIATLTPDQLSNMWVDDTTLCVDHLTFEYRYGYIHIFVYGGPDCLCSQCSNPQYYYYKCGISDCVGNQMDVFWQYYTVDADGPTITWRGSSWCDRPLLFEITDDMSGLHHVYVHEDGVLVDNVIVQDPQDPDFWHLTPTPGAYEIDIEAVDNLGNTTVYTFYNTADCEPPVLTFLPGYVRCDYVTVSFMLTDAGSGVDWDMVYLDLYYSSNYILTFDPDQIDSLKSGDTVTVTITGDDALYLQLYNGATLNAVVYSEKNYGTSYTKGPQDLAGNYETSLNYFRGYYYADCSAPSITWKNSSDPCDRPIKLEITDSKSGVAEVHVYEDDSEYEEALFYNPTTGLWEYTPAAGMHELDVVATDVVGNQKTYTFDVKDDCQGPAVSFATGYVTKNPTIKFTVSDPSGVDWATVNARVYGCGEECYYEAPALQEHVNFETGEVTLDGCNLDCSDGNEVEVWVYSGTYYAGQGPADSAGNYLPKYAKCSFVVDADKPYVKSASSTSTRPIKICITDERSGVDWSTLEFWEDSLLICEGLGCVDSTVDLDIATGCIEYEPGAGRKHVEIRVSDYAGNLLIYTFYTEEEFLIFTDPHNYPNPFDPRDGKTKIALGLSRSAYVTVKIYDFAGEFVSTVAFNQYVSTSQTLRWDGTTEGGTDVANGTYLCYIKAKDSDGATKTAVIKITVLKQDK